MAEARLRQKKGENASLHRKIESYHVRWLQYEIRLTSLKETIDEQMASLQMALESTKRSHEMKMTSYDCHRHESSESHMKMCEDTSARLRHGCGSHVGVIVRRSSAVNRVGVEFRQQSQAPESGAAPWQPAAPGGNSIDDLNNLKSQFRIWKKDYKARLRKAAMAELDSERKHRSSCWI
ncbi:hypothetical protein E2562_038206 [Oryza meyeriana var. granulata]|nr:hypothetical protein E2562_038206 [Oryza meyeriana var. granulata]